MGRLMISTSDTVALISGTSALSSLMTSHISISHFYSSRRRLKTCRLVPSCILESGRVDAMWFAQVRCYKRRHCTGRRIRWTANYTAVLIISHVWYYQISVTFLIFIHINNFWEHITNKQTIKDAHNSITSRAVQVDFIYFFIYR